MAGRLRYTVHLPDVGEGPRSFGPEDSIPDEVAQLITNPKAWEDGEAPTPPASKSPSTPKAPAKGN